MLYSAWHVQHLTIYTKCETENEYHSQKQKRLNRDEAWIQPGEVIYIIMVSDLNTFRLFFREHYPLWSANHALNDLLLILFVFLYRGSFVDPSLGPPYSKSFYWELCRRFGASSEHGLPQEGVCCSFSARKVVQSFPLITKYQEYCCSFLLHRGNEHGVSEWRWDQ